MSHFREMMIIMVALAAVLLAAGCVDHSSGPVTGSAPSVTVALNETTPAQLSLVPAEPEPKLYTVIQGEPFTYQGFVNDTNVRSVGVQLNSQADFGVSPLSVPVNANGTFTLTIGGNLTKAFWDEYTNELSYNRDASPYLHVSLNDTTKKENFDLLVVQDEKNITSLQPDLWIQIDPLHDLVIPPEERNEYTGPFIVNGTTNLNIGENLSIELSSICAMPCPPQPSPGRIGCCGDNPRHIEYTRVQGSSNGTNTWSFLVNTAPDRFVIYQINDRIDDHNPFQLYVADVNRTIGDNRWDQANFFLKVLGTP